MPINPTATIITKPNNARGNSENEITVNWNDVFRESKTGRIFWNINGSGVVYECTHGQCLKCGQVTKAEELNEWMKCKPCQSLEKE